MTRRFYWYLTFGLIGLVTLALYLFNPKVDVEKIFGTGSFDFVVYDILGPIFLYGMLALVALDIWTVSLKRGASYLSDTATNNFSLLGRLIIIPFATFGFLNNFEAFQGTLLGWSAILGIAIGFSATNTIGNLLAGFYLLIIRPFAIGDYVQFTKLKTEGVVTEITINFTVIRKPTGNQELISNLSILNQVVTQTLVQHKKTGQREEREHLSLYKYNLRWGLSPSEPHSLAMAAISKTMTEFASEFSKKPEWYVVEMGRLETAYNIEIPVKDPNRLLVLPQLVLGRLADNFALLKKEQAIP